MTIAWFGLCLLVLCLLGVFVDALLDLEMMAVNWIAAFGVVGVVFIIYGVLHP